MGVLGAELYERMETQLRAREAAALKTELVSYSVVTDGKVVAGTVPHEQLNRVLGEIREEMKGVLGEYLGEAEIHPNAAYGSRTGIVLADVSVEGTARVRYPNREIKPTKVSLPRELILDREGLAVECFRPGFVPAVSGGEIRRIYEERGVFFYDDPAFGKRKVADAFNVTPERIRARLESEVDKETALFED